MVLALFRETQIGALQNFLEQNRTFCYGHETVILLLMRNQLYNMTLYEVVL